ncbi:MAG TPA: hypothetical protein GX404_09325 [Syntrophomonadaceae bacterium]|nr:hypothetical protein [Syntrophomonadaceae bacterium]
MYFIEPEYEASTVIGPAQTDAFTENTSPNYILREDTDYRRLTEENLDEAVINTDTSKYMEMVQSSWVLEETIKKLDLECSPEQLKSMIRTEQKDEKDPNLTIIVSYNDRVMAAKIANTLVQQLQIHIRNLQAEQIDGAYRIIGKQQEIAQAELDQALKDLQTYKLEKAQQSPADSAEEISSQVEEKRLDNAVRRGNDTIDLLNAKMLGLKISRSFVESEDSIIVLSPAVAPESPVKPNKKLNVAIAAVLGLLCSIFGVFLAEYLRQDPLDNETY